MVKRKNHTNSNQTFKAHRNGIHQPKNWKLKVKSLKFRGMKGMDPQFRRNQNYAKAGLLKLAARKRQSARDKSRNEAAKQSKEQPPVKK
mmetsp:Transcript_51637/g.85563  ORF Transcript_51637/g.85563 Transcript_51637/m.85563 type:complete len:89 (+) Transcript_51637:80-346(+)|eukprot:CAMPEP_0202688298 /NCGR_PEP_ID=MMETSP1385-20130828/3819_1 /ASSEMBLY_ACC=CAM_ASM_000861 /TAXON_ID=933848 /ORGANISM="Elphidium margaritaceum" /LENGTH=88 /DNA_ID=CAMNT_0049343235 /DNA_START=71 /DNA_END=337 /DNA_ORIENTATION=+